MGELGGQYLASSRPRIGIPETLFPPQVAPDRGSQCFRPLPDEVPAKAGRWSVFTKMVKYI